MRSEQDFIGSVHIEKNALYGIHSVRAKNNFPDKSPFNKEWYKAIGIVKLASYIVAGEYFQEIQKKYPKKEHKINIIDNKTIDLLRDTAKEVSKGKYFEHYIVPAISGGAGTSINLNINEIICNATLIKLNKEPGEYQYLDPIEHCNIFQSTNDVVPTSLRIAIMQYLNKLEFSINSLRSEIENLEKKYTDALRIGYTQMQKAVPTSFSRLFSNYNDALSRDWWRVSKCFERIKTVNLGGSAIGTGITVPRYFIMNVVQEIQKLTDLPITRSENLTDNTSNLDSFVEIHATLKSHAVNLEKLAGDLRILSSDIHGSKEIEIPQMQVGSSIMPGKVNPVISEFLISCAHKIYANDQIVSSLCGQGCLELNAYIPVIGDALLNSLELLIACNHTCEENLIKGLIVNKDKALKSMLSSPSVTTVLIPLLGYNKCGEIARYMKENNCDIYTCNDKLSFMDKDKLKEMLTAANFMNLGFRIQDYL